MKRLLLALSVAFMARFAFGVDGQILINQSTVMAAGGFPYVINQSGSYKLSGNLEVPSGSSGIAISVPNVTLDLNGFSIVTPAQTSLGGPIGITVIASHITPSGMTIANDVSGITIRNGIIRGFSFAIYAGITALSSYPSWTLQDLQFIWGNGISNLQVGPNSHVINVSATDFAFEITCPAIVTMTTAYSILPMQLNCSLTNNSTVTQ